MPVDIVERAKEVQKFVLVEQHRKALFEDGLLSDFTIVCDGEGEKEEVKFRVHRAILVARSEYFKAMLTAGDFAETRTGLMKAEGFAPATIRALLEFVYTGELAREATLFPALDQLMRWKELFRAADMYQVEGLKAICERKLAEGLSAENALDLLLFADQFPANKTSGILRAAAIRFVNAHKTEMTKSSADGGLSVIDPQKVGRFREFAESHPKLMVELWMEGAPPVASLPSSERPPMYKTYMTCESRPFQEVPTQQPHNIAVSNIFPGGVPVQQQPSSNIFPGGGVRIPQFDFSSGNNNKNKNNFGEGDDGFGGGGGKKNCPGGGGEGGLF